MPIDNSIKSFGVVKFISSFVQVLLSNHGLQEVLQKNKTEKCTKSKVLLVLNPNKTNMEPDSPPLNFRSPFYQKSLKKIKKKKKLGIFTIDDILHKYIVDKITSIHIPMNKIQDKII